MRRSRGRREEGGLTREEKLPRTPRCLWLERDELDRRLRWELGTWCVGRRWSMVNNSAPSRPVPTSPHASPEKGRNRNEGSRCHVMILPTNIHVRQCHGF